MTLHPTPLPLRILIVLAAIAMLLLAPLAQAAPFLQTRAAYPFPANIPKTAYTFTARATPGPFSLTCTLVADVPKCDAAPALAVAVPLVTFVMDVSRVAGCDADGANCWPAGSVSSAPFLRTLLDLPVGSPTGLFLAP